MRPGHIYRRGEGGPLVMDGTSRVTYRVSTIGAVDAALGHLCKGHPDVDLLLDARRVISMLNCT